jgi:hypothetical protein
MAIGPAPYQRPPREASGSGLGMVETKEPGVEGVPSVLFPCRHGQLHVVERGQPEAHALNLPAPLGPGKPAGPGQPVIQ